MNDVLNLVVGFVLQFVTFLFVARFLLQACRVDFYNPLSQGIVKFTDPLLRPLRMVLPGYRNLDFAAFTAAVVAQIVMLLLLSSIQNAYMGSVGIVIAKGILSVILLALWMFRWSIFIVIIASWIVPGNYHPALALLQQITEPLMAPVRRLLPSMGGLDLSPLVVILVLLVLESILQQVLYSM